MPQLWSLGASSATTLQIQNFQRNPFDRRTLPPADSPLHSRADQPIAWCAPHSSTYVVITAEYNLEPVFDTDVHMLLVDAYNYVMTEIQQHGDGVLPYRFTTCKILGWIRASKNANNHQQTCALMAIGEYKEQYVGGFAAITFAVFDGVNQVGTGAFQLL
ncbi:hypothetical protein MMC08_004577 [Hypocenomyce scalaris]|nr:hypothetical protein [Hypocenomyce scalaris]